MLSVVLTVLIKRFSVSRGLSCQLHKANMFNIALTKKILNKFFMMVCEFELVVPLNSHNNYIKVVWRRRKIIFSLVTNDHIFLWSFCEYAAQNCCFWDWDWDFNISCKSKVSLNIPCRRFNLNSDWAPETILNYKWILFGVLFSFR